MRWSWSDEVAVLEEALQQAIAKQVTAGNLRESGNRSASAPRRKELDSALATYGFQLRAWMDVQVDARLAQILPNLVEGELATVQAESSTVCHAVDNLRQKSEADIKAVAEAQGKLLKVVEGISRELARWKTDRAAEKASGAVGHAKNSLHDSRQLELSSEVKQLKEMVTSMEGQLASEEESARELSAWAQQRFAGEGHRSHELEKKVADLERRTSLHLEQLSSDFTVKASSSAWSDLEMKLQGLREDLKGQLEARVGVLRDWCESSNKEQDSKIRANRGDIESKTEAKLRALERQLESRLGSQVSQVERRVSSRFDELNTEFTDRRIDRGPARPGGSSLTAMSSEILSHMEQASSSAWSEFELKLQSLREDLKGQLEARVGVLRDWCESSKKEQDSKIRANRGDIESKTEAQLRALERQLESRLGSQVSQLEAIEEKVRSELGTMRSECCQDMQSQLEETRAHLGEDLASLQRRLEQDSRIRSNRGDIESKTEAKLRALERQLESRLGSQVAQLEAIDEKLQSEMRSLRSECCQEMKSQLEETQTHLGEDLASLHRRLVSELRAETMAALNRDSAAIASLDEQLWISDQRLGRRIDELVHAQRHGRSSQESTETCRAFGPDDSGLGSEHAPAPTETTFAEKRKSSGGVGVLATAKLAAKSLLEASREEEDDEGDGSRPRRIFGHALTARDSRRSASQRAPTRRSGGFSFAADEQGERTSQARGRAESCKAGTRRSGKGVLAMVAEAAEAFAESAEFDG